MTEKKQDQKFVLDAYQAQGAAWLAGRRRALLADTMGIGKSPQAIAALDMCEAKRVVIVCQAGKRTGWERDVKRWSPGRPVFYAMYKKEMSPLPLGVTIVSYDQADLMAEAARELGFRFDVCIIDEIQFLKSPTAKRTANVLGAKGIANLCDRIWLLSGTPMLNHPGEMWTWLYTLFPQTIAKADGKPMSYDEYVDRYCVKRVTQWGDTIVGGKNMEELKAKLALISLRRGEEVLENLPPIEFSDLKLDMSLVKGNPDVDKMLELQATPDVKAFVQQMLDCEQGKDEFPGEHVYIGRQNTPSPITTMRRWTAIVKAYALAPVLADMLRRGELYKVVVFAIHRDAIVMLERFLSAEGYMPVVVWGGTPAYKRDKFMEQFLQSRKRRVFIGQIHSTGTGVDGLQHATSDVVFLETDWTPGGNVQAIKRVHRRGQTDPVRVRFAYLDNSVDEIVNRVVKRKTKTLAEIFA